MRGSKCMPVAYIRRAVHQVLTTRDSTFLDTAGVRIEMKLISPT